MMVRISIGDRIGIDNAFLLYFSCKKEEEKKEKNQKQNKKSNYQFY